MLENRRVDAKSGPDTHGTVMVICPYCDLDHYYSWNTFQDNSEMTRRAGCRLSKDGYVIITLENMPAPIAPLVASKRRYVLPTRVV